MTRFEHHDAVEAVLDGMRTRLSTHGFERHAALLDALARDSLTPAHPAPATLPVLRHFDAAITLSDREPTADLSTAIAGLGRTADWTRTAAYVSNPPSPNFLDDYAHATLAGLPDGVQEGEGPASGASVGLLLLGPDVHYPPHQHPADEVYLPLTEARWVHGRDQQYRPEPAGTLLHHRPWQAHGMLTTGAPLLAIYLWTGDVRTPSRFC